MTPQRPVREAQIIPAHNSGVTALYVHAFLALLAGLALRLLFALKFPSSADDSEIYLQLARNWADFHVYGLWVNGHLVPTDIRTPGYPAFLAALAMILRRSMRAIVLSQAAIDLESTRLLAASLGAGNLATGPCPTSPHHRGTVAGCNLSICSELLGGGPYRSPHGVSDNRRADLFRRRASRARVYEACPETITVCTA